MRLKTVLGVILQGFGTGVPEDKLLLEEESECWDMLPNGGGATRVPVHVLIAPSIARGDNRPIRPKIWIDILLMKHCLLARYNVTHIPGWSLYQFGAGSLGLMAWIIV